MKEKKPQLTLTGFELATFVSYAFALTTRPQGHPRFCPTQSCIYTQLLSEVISPIVFINFNLLQVEFCVRKLYYLLYTRLIGSETKILT